LKTFLAEGERGGGVIIFEHPGNTLLQYIANFELRNLFSIIMTHIYMAMR